MVLQAFIDDSYSNSGVFVLGGHIATAESWAAFSKDWAELLPRFGVLAKDNKYHFKMSEMTSFGRIKNVPPFYRVLENHVMCSLACAYNINDLKNAKKRISIPGIPIDWGFLDNHYIFSFRILMDMFHAHRKEWEQVIPVEQKIDFCFDNQAEKKLIISMWDDYMKERPEEFKGRYGARPRFEDDKEFLPLQAADLWASWVRKWTEEGTVDQMEDCDFGEWKAMRPKHPKIYIQLSEEDIVTNIKKLMHPQLPIGCPIYDVRFGSSLQSSS